jgi:hypothetical protein
VLNEGERSAVRGPHVPTNLQQRILNYVRENANAAETAKGVNDVWLARPWTTESIAEVEQALDELAARGVLEKHSLPGRTIYRMNQGSGAPAREE